MYRDISRRVFAGQYLDDGEDPEPLDYTFYVFRGRCGAIHVDLNRSSDHTRATFARDLVFLPYRNDYPMAQPGRVTKPVNYDEMLRVAETLGRDFSFIRVDLYSIRQRIYFGE